MTTIGDHRPEEAVLGLAKLGSLEVSRIGLGCMGMAEFYGDRGEAESIRPIHEAVDLGMDFLDTADMYGAGLREEITFDAFTARREQRCRLVVESSIEIGRLEQQQAPPQAQTAVVKRVLAKLTEPV